MQNSRFESKGVQFLFICFILFNKSKAEGIANSTTLSSTALSDLNTTAALPYADEKTEAVFWKLHYWSKDRSAAVATEELPVEAQSSQTVRRNEANKINKDFSIYNESLTKTDLPTDFENHPCRRVCQPGKALSCYYKLVGHSYQRLGSECVRCQYDVKACAAERCIFGDGVSTPIMAVNYMMPGPAIEACQNDTIIVDFSNYLLEPLTLHMHGLPMSQTPEADGVPFITQYPIQSGETFRYSFQAERSGTVWYHSQMNYQRALGIAGAFVIRQTRFANPHVQLYDYDLVEHTLFIQEAFYNLDVTRPRNILINGKGRNHLNNLVDNDTRHRYERVRVTPRSRYRMRVINNGIVDCPIELSIENHKMLVIATDGNDISPILADSFFMASGERFDFVLDANQSPSNYWIRVRGYNNCSKENLYQGAVLHYRGSARNQQPLSAGLFSIEKNDNSIFEGMAANAHDKKLTEMAVVNRPLDVRGIVYKNSEASLKANNIATASLRSMTPLPWSPYTQFLTYYSSFGHQKLSNGQHVFQIDDITYDSPQVSLLQTRFLYNEDSLTCNRSVLSAAGYDCLNTNCGCTNMIRLPAYKPIELVVVNYMETNHPLHLHGYTFRVVGQGIVGNTNDLRRVRDLDRRGVLQRSPPDFPAVQKDTVQLPGLGYVILRFISNNPGYWFYHSNIEEAALEGMSAVVKIGENNQIKRIPTKVRC